MQADAPFWKGTKMQVTKTKTKPDQRKKKYATADEPVARGESPQADNQLEVELDSLGHLFTELADASYSQG